MNIKMTKSCALWTLIAQRRGLLARLTNNSRDSGFVMKELTQAYFFE